MICGHGCLSGLRIGDRTFVGLGLQGKPDGSSLRNVFEGSFTEESTRGGKAIFEGGLKFAASETRKKLYSTYYSTQRY